MKTIMIEAKVFEPGDRVITPLGEGTVVDDEALRVESGSECKGFSWHKVLVQHDESCGENPDNRTKVMDREGVTFLKEEQEVTILSTFEDFLVAYTLSEFPTTGLMAETLTKLHNAIFPTDLEKQFFQERVESKIFEIEHKHKE